MSEFLNRVIIYFCCIAGVISSYCKPFRLIGFLGGGFKKNKKINARY